MTTKRRETGVRALKATIRAAAEWACQKCGLTNRQHHRRYNKQLHVHRKVPGSEYTPEGCEVLCRPCHARAHGMTPGKYPVLFDPSLRRPYPKPEK